MSDGVCIVGGGIGGLTAAIALQQFGARVDVFEQASCFEPVGAGITVQANAAAILQVLDVELTSVDVCPIGRFQMINPSGRVLMRGSSEEIPVEYPSVNVHRADLHAALLARLEGTNVRCHLGHAFESLSETPEHVVVKFANGHSITCGLLIAADGMHSRVRDCLLGAGGQVTRYSGQTCWRFALEAPDLVPGVTIERWAPGRRAGIIPLTRGRVYVYLVKTSDRGTPESQVTTPDLLRRYFGGLSSEMDAILERLGDDVAVHHGDLVDQPQIHFGRQRIVLIGDAAHGMTPNLGQGAGMAIEDAATLGLLYQSHVDTPQDIAVALSDRRLERIRQIHTTSWRIGKIAHLKSRWLQVLRDWLLSHLPKAMSDRQIQQLWAPGIALSHELRDAIARDAP